MTDTNQDYSLEEDNIFYPEIMLKDGFIWEDRGEKKGLSKVGKAIQIRTVHENIDTGEVSFTVTFEYNGRLKETTISRADFQRNKIIELAKLGADVYEYNATQVIKHLINEEINAPQNKVHQKLGWDTYGDQLIFKHYKTIGINSTYNGPLAIQPKGSYKKWRLAVEKWVMGNRNLELAILIGLSSAVVGLISSATKIDSLIFHIYGLSTQGKTTATSLAISTFGYPETNQNGLMQTWMSTQNAIIGNLVGNFGLIFGLDEISMSDIQDFSTIAYYLAGGKEKGRLDKESRLKEAGAWSTTIVSNGERALTSKANHNIGIVMRILELGHIKWTHDAKSADQIKHVIQQNYGHAGPKFAKVLLAKGRAQVVQMWQECTQRIIDAMPEQSHFSQRIAKKLAILMLTGEIAKEALQLDFDLKGIQNLLIENEKAVKDDRDLGAKALEYFYEQFAMNRSNFSDLKRIRSKGSHMDVAVLENRKVFGGLYKKSGEKFVYILPTVFHQWMKDGGFDEPKVVLKDWKTRGLLDTEGDRYTRKRKIHDESTTVPVYCIRLNPDEADVNDA
ncbi:DUF927 domain-containing protein [Paenibacillus sp. 23TSA30-6]|uniref:DUF927 domain-containing protein n=1 Tax=Paenibacillus sp. 23TSA30-6 TaxID=2546104 RepID=UPI0017879202|nr:DUF927 domain-containing protein [Paenibacillus sp. 23TSA30-6]MBE0338698.1 DUF927 domain-containing protein [Paenibacillus sp. 23TSA30-6]